MEGQIFVSPVRLPPGRVEARAGGREHTNPDFPCLLRLGGERRREEAASMGADGGSPIHHSIT